MRNPRQSEALRVTMRGLSFRGRHLPCTIGRSGVTTQKKEGDAATPVGTHRIIGMLYRPDRLPRPASWAQPLRRSDIWVDDPRSAKYNHFSQAPEPLSHERLWRADPLYDLVLLTDWNWPEARAGLGSAIFMHRWRRRGFPTEGCVALRSDHLLWLSQRIRPGAELTIK